MDHNNTPGARQSRDLPPARLLQHLPRRRQVDLIDHLAVEPDHAAPFGLRRRHRLDYPLGFGDLFGGGREDFVDDLDMRGMDDGFAVVAQVARGLASAPQPSKIFNREIRRIVGRDPGGARGQQYVRTREQHFSLVLAQYRAQIARQVGRPEHQSGDQFVRFGDLAAGEDPARRFDQAEQLARLAAYRLMIFALHNRGDGRHVFNALALRDDEAGGADRDYSSRVLQSPLRDERVDAYENLFAAEVNFIERANDRRASFELLIRRNAVFKVEYQAVSRRIARLQNHPFGYSRDVKQTPHHACLQHHPPVAGLFGISARRRKTNTASPLWLRARVST